MSDTSPDRRIAHDEMESYVYWRRTADKDDWKSLDDYLIFLRSKIPYQYAKNISNGKSVLDYGCGSGYGSMLLSDVAKSVMGVDVDGRVIEYCSKRYADRKLSFKTIEPDKALPFPDGCFDVVLSFQVIEHVTDVGLYLSEISRVLQKGGVAFISTPNKSLRLRAFQKPWNDEHLREYTGKELLKIVGPHFQSVSMRCVAGSDGVMTIEKQRLKHLRSPFNAYLPGWMKKMVPERLKNKVRQSHSTPEKLGDDVLSKYSGTDFFIADLKKDALDLFAICRK